MGHSLFFLQAGFTLGLFLILGVAALSYYTLNLVLMMADEMRFKQVDGSKELEDFSDVCRFFVGRKFGKVTVLMSLVTMFTAAIGKFKVMNEATANHTNKRSNQISDFANFCSFAFYGTFSFRNSALNWWRNFFHQILCGLGFAVNSL